MGNLTAIAKNVAESYKWSEAYLEAYWFLHVGASKMSRRQDSSTTQHTSYWLKAIAWGKYTPHIT